MFAFYFSSTTLLCSSGGEDNWDDFQGQAVACFAAWVTWDSKLWVCMNELCSTCPKSRICHLLQWKQQEITISINYLPFYFLLVVVSCCGVLFCLQQGQVTHSSGIGRTEYSPQTFIGSSCIASVSPSSSVFQCCHLLLALQEYLLLWSELDDFWVSFLSSSLLFATSKENKSKTLFI